MKNTVYLEDLKASLVLPCFPLVLHIRYGELGDVYMPRDLRTGEPRGFAFVRYMSQRDADDAIDRLDGEFFAGRELRIQVGFWFCYLHPLFESVLRVIEWFRQSSIGHESRKC